MAELDGCDAARRVDTDLPGLGRTDHCRHLTEMLAEETLRVDQMLDCVTDPTTVGQDGLEQYLVIRHRHVLDREALDRGVEPPERLPGEYGRDLGAKPCRERVLVDDQTATGPPHTIQDHLAVPRRDGA